MNAIAIQCLLVLGFISEAMSLKAAVPNKQAGIPFDIPAALMDYPPGSWYELMSPAIEVVTLTYDAIEGPEAVEGREKVAGIAKEFSGRLTNNWVRIPELDRRHPKEDMSAMERPGISVIAFRDDASKRAMIGFRGGCLNTTWNECRADMCMMNRVQGWGEISAEVFGSPAELGCDNYKDDPSFWDQAEAVVKQAIEMMPGYAILLVGHSMGGHLSSVMAAKFKAEGVQALTFAPSPFYEHLKDIMPEKQISELDNLWAVCDTYDCGLNTFYVPEARHGGMTCLFEEWDDEPDPCHGVKKIVADMVIDDISERNQTMRCKSQSHAWPRYKRMLRMMKPNTTTVPASLPTCTTDFSTLTPKLAKAFRFHRLLGKSGGSLEPL